MLSRLKLNLSLPFYQFTNLSLPNFGRSETCLSRAIYQLSTRPHFGGVFGSAIKRRPDKLADMPGPLRLPFSNHLLFEPLTKLSNSFLPLPELYQKYGRIVRTQVFKESMVTVFNPDDVERIMKLPLDAADRPEMVLVKEARESLTKYYGSCLGISLSTGKDYINLMEKLGLLQGFRTKIRKMYDDPLEPDLKFMYDADSEPTVSILDNMDVHYWHTGQQKVAEKLVGLMELNRFLTGEIKAEKLESLISKWSVEANGYFFLSSSVGTMSEQNEADAFIEAAGDAMDAMVALERGPLNWVLNKELSPHYKKLVESQREAARITLMYYRREIEYIDQRKRSGVKSPNKNIKLLEWWINKGVFNSDLLAVLTDLMGAGVKTTATGVYRTLEFLGENQDKQHELVKKLQESSKNVDGSKYLHASWAFREALRMKPVFPTVLRRLGERVELNNYYIPSGTLIQIPLEFLCNQNQSVENHREYKPERWRINEFGHLSTGLSEDYLFGGGIRSCPCKKIALLTAEVVIAEIVKRFRIETEEYRTAYSPNFPLHHKSVYTVEEMLRRRPIKKKLIFHDREN